MDSPMSVAGEAAPAGANVTALTPRLRRGIVYDKWPFRLDICVEYQDWILVAMSFLLISIWCLPCICGRMKNGVAKAFTSWVYTRLHTFFIVITYFNLFLMMLTIGVLPDWTVDEFGYYALRCLSWVLVHLKKIITSVCILAAFYLTIKFRERIAMAAGLEHVTVFRCNWRDVLGWFGWTVKQRPVEIFFWKVEDLPSSAGKVLKANDIFIECHMGNNETMRTRVHNNAGHSCDLKQSLQMNIEEDLNSILTLQVKDQALLVSTEIARLNLSVREIFGIEDQTGKRRASFSYSEESFVSLNLIPRGKIWLAIAPVDDLDEEHQPFLQEDSLVTC